MRIKRRKLIKGSLTSVLVPFFPNPGERPRLDSHKGNWPAPRFDKGNTSYTPEDGAVRGLEEAWRKRNLESVGTPTVVRDTVYVADGNTLYAYAAEDGSKMWDLTLSGTVDENPSFFNGSVYITGGSVTYSIDPDNGEIEWEHRGRGGSSATPKTDTRRVYAAKDNHLYALGIHTGQKLWKTSIGGVTSPPALYNGRIYAGSESGDMLSIDPENGEIIWRESVGNSINIPPIITELGVFAVSQQGEGVLFTPDGVIEWRRSFNSAISSTAATDDDHIYVPTEEGLLRAVNIRGGGVAWTFEADEDTLSSPSVAGRGIYIAANSREQSSSLYVLNSFDGEVITQRGFFSSWSPAIVGNELFFSGHDMICLNGEVAPVGSSVEVTEVTLDENEVESGEEYTLTAVLSNEGTRRGDIELRLTRGGSIDVPPETYSVVADDDREIKMRATALTDGVYEIELNGVSAGTLTVGDRESDQDGLREDNQTVDQDSSNFSEEDGGQDIRKEGNQADFPDNGEVSESETGAQRKKENGESGILSVQQLEDIDIQDLLPSGITTYQAGMGTAAAGSVAVAFAYLLRNRNGNKKDRDSGNNKNDKKTSGTTEAQGLSRDPADNKVGKDPRDVIDTLKNGSQTERFQSAEHLLDFVDEEPDLLMEYEHGLLEVLDVEDEWIKKRAISALSKVGTQTSIEKLEQIEMFEAEQAVESIEKRLRKKENKIRYPDINAEYENFKKIRLIDSGGNADIYEAEIRTQTGLETVALKTPKMHNYDTVDKQLFEDFAREAEIWSKIDDHENIVKVLDWDKNPHPWIALEYMDGGSLDDKDLDMLETAEVLIDLASVMNYSHRHGVAHGDLKPGNILFKKVGRKETVKISDWGLAKVLMDHSESVRGITIRYSSPEQVEPETYGKVDDKTDIYQLAAVAYEQLTGETVFEYDSRAAVLNATIKEKPRQPSELNSQIPKELDDVLLKALSKSKENRQESMLYLRDGLRDAFGVEE